MLSFQITYLVFSLVLLLLHEQDYGANAVGVRNHHSYEHPVVQKHLHGQILSCNPYFFCSGQVMLAHKNCF